MILVDINVPILGKVYEYKIEEDLAMQVVIRDFYENTCHMEQCLRVEHKEELMLWDIVKQKRIIPEWLKIKTFKLQVRETINKLKIRRTYYGRNY